MTNDAYQERTRDYADAVRIAKKVSKAANLNFWGTNLGMMTGAASIFLVSGPMMTLLVPPAILLGTAVLSRTATRSLRHEFNEMSRGVVPGARFVLRPIDAYLPMKKPLSVDDFNPQHFPWRIWGAAAITLFLRSPALGLLWLTGDMALREIRANLELTRKANDVALQYQRSAFTRTGPV
jgi:hypothetical protein